MNSVPFFDFNDDPVHSWVAAMKSIAPYLEEKARQVAIKSPTSVLSTTKTLQERVRDAISSWNMWTLDDVKYLVEISKDPDRSKYLREIYAKKVELYPGAFSESN